MDSMLCDTDEDDEMPVLEYSSDEDDADCGSDSDEAESLDALSQLRAAQDGVRREALYKAQHPGNAKGNKNGGFDFKRTDMDLRFGQWDDHYFKRFYRVSKKTFIRLVDLLGPAIERNPSMASVSTEAGCVSQQLHLAVTLRWLAGGSYLDIHQDHGVARSTFWHCLHCTLAAIDSCEELDFVFPANTESELRPIAKEFEVKSEQGSFRDAVGAIDGILIGIQCPTSVPNPGRYYTRKCKYALNVQAICDARRKFSWVSILTPGSVHDSVAFGLTELAAALSDGWLPAPFYILGDAAYSGIAGILVPAPGTDLDMATDSFNFHLSQLRINIECAFGILVQRWGIFWRNLRVRFDRLNLVITCTMKLHNLCMDELDTPPPLDPEEEELDPVQEFVQPGIAEHARATAQLQGGGGHTHACMDETRASLIDLMRELRMPRPLVRRFDDA